MNFKTRTLFNIVAILSIVLAVISSTSQPAYGRPAVVDTPPTSFVIGIAPGATGEAAEIIIDGIKNLASAAEKGTSFTIYDALKNRKITGFTTPTGRSDRLNEREINKSVKPVSAYLDRAQTVRSGEASEVNLPSFLDSISSSVRLGGGGTRVVIFGSLFFNDDREPHASFTEGFAPSDGFLLQSSYQNIFGTSDKEGALSGVAVDICTLGHQAGSLEQRSVERFWSLFLSRQNAALCTVEAYPDVLITRAVAGAVDPVTTSAIDLSDTVLEIRPVRKPTPVLVPHREPESEPARKPQDKSITLSQTSIKVDTMFIVDGTGSMGPFLPESKRVVTDSAKLGSRLTPGFAFGAVINRIPKLTAVFELMKCTPAISSEIDEPYSTWNVFAYHRILDHGGKTFRSFDGTPTFSDTEGAVRTSLLQLANGEGNRKILVCIGDRGPFEMDGELNGMSDEDIRAKDRTLTMVRNFKATYKDFRIVAMFTGDPNGSKVDQASAAFFEELAEIGGSNSVYLENLFELEQSVAQAILND